MPASVETSRHCGLLKLRALLLCSLMALDGSAEPLAGLHDLELLDVEVCFGLAGGLQTLAPLPQLATLSVCDTKLQLDVTALVAQRRRVLQLSLGSVHNVGGALMVGGRDGQWEDDVTPLLRAVCGQVDKVEGTGGNCKHTTPQNGRFPAHAKSFESPHSAGLSHASNIFVSLENNWWSHRVHHTRAYPSRTLAIRRT